MVGEAKLLPLLQKRSLSALIVVHGDIHPEVNDIPVALLVQFGHREMHCLAVVDADEGEWANGIRESIVAGEVIDDHGLSDPAELCKILILEFGCMQDDPDDVICCTGTDCILNFLIVSDIQIDEAEGNALLAKCSVKDHADVGPEIQFCTLNVMHAAGCHEDVDLLSTSCCAGGGSPCRRGALQTLFTGENRLSGGCTHAWFVVQCKGDGGL